MFEEARVKDFVKMEKTENRAVIKYMNLKGMTASEIHADMVRTLADSAPSYATVTRWIRDFKRGRDSVEDDPRSGRPATATTKDNLDLALQMVMQDRRISCRQIAERLGISLERADNILTNELGFAKVSARWVPRLLTPEQKRIRWTVSKSNLELFEADEDNFLARFITMDESWVHHYQPETKVQSKQWKHTSSPTPKKAKVVPSAGKVMASVFWDSQGVILIEYLEKGHTVTGQHYSGQLKRLREAIKEKRPGMLTRGILFHQDNAPAHTSLVAMATIHECGFELVPHPPYSPDLAPSDFHLFPQMKKALSGRHFASDEDVMAAVERYLESQTKEFFYTGIKALHHRWNKCSALEGDYVEK